MCPGMHRPGKRMVVVQLETDTSRKRTVCSDTLTGKVCRHGPIPIEVCVFMFDLCGVFLWACPWTYE